MHNAIFLYIWIVEKRRLTVIVEIASDGTFCCYIEDEEKDFGAAGYGSTSEEAIRDFYEACTELREEHAKDGRIIPEYDYVFKYDLRSFFDYFDCFNVKKIAEMSGINYAQLNQYLTGRRNASRKQYEKLSGCIRKITAGLEKATF